MSTETQAPATCVRCGVCCRRQPVPPFELGMPELDGVPELREELLAYIKSPAFDDDAPCLWLTPTGRKYYELRPAICREYEPGCETCAGDGG